MTTSRSRRAALLLLWLIFLGGTLASLHTVGGTLAPPPLTELGQMTGWMQERQPAEAAFALLRLVGLGTGWYLLAASVGGALARLTRLPVLVRFLDGLTVPAVRQLVNAVAGASVATATLTTGTSMAMTLDDRSAPRQPVTVTALAGAASDPTGVAPIPDPTTEGAGVERGRASEPAQAPAPPTLRRLPDDDPPRPAPPAPSAPPASLTSPAPPLPQLQPARWEIQAGQHLWAVAEAVLASAWQRPPTDAEVDPYWRHLVETNRSMLRDRANPDLVYPGQVLTIPPPPAALPATEAPKLIPKAAP